MRVEEFEKFKTGVAGVMGFYGKDVSQFALDVWWQALKNFDLAAITDAFNRHLVNPDNGQFAPKPADIVRLLQGSTQDVAMKAWSKVDKTVRLVGPYQSVVFDDPIIHAVIVAMGGWIALGAKTEDEWPFVQREFEARYRGYCVRGRDQMQYPRLLTGIAEAQNSLDNKKIDPPVLIGNKDQAALVYRGGSEVEALTVTRASDYLPQQLTGS